MTLENYLEYQDLEKILFLSRLYLGKIEMPYTKSRLVERLKAFLTPERIEKLVRSANEEESSLISLLHIFGAMDEKKLAFFSGLSEIRTSLYLNRLSMRLLVFKNDDDLWEENESFDLSLLYSNSILKSKQPQAERDDMNLTDIIAGMASILSAENLLNSRKDNLRYLRAIGISDHFPKIGKEKAELIASAFIRTGLNCGFLSNESGFVKPTEKLRDLKDFSDIQLAYLLFSEGNFNKRSLSAFLAQDIYGVEEVNDKLRVIYPEIDKALLFLSLIGNREKSTESTFVLSSDYTLTSSMRDESFILSRFMTVDKVDTYTTWTLTREGVKSGFDSGLTAESIIEYLSTFTTVPEAIQERLRNWNESYDRVRVYDYLYIETDERNARLIDSHPLMSIHIVKKVSNTGYLMKRSTEEQWRRILMYTGLEMVGKTEREDGLITIYSEKLPNDRLEEYKHASYPTLLDRQYIKKKSYSDNLFKIDIASKLKTKEEKESFTRLLDIGCIIDPSQIVPGQPFYQGRKATGFEYQVKLHLLRQSIKEGFFVSLALEEENYIAKIESINKVDNKDIAIIIDENGKRIELDISKIFLVREITF
ncbi:MAG: helicase-associated domain-containing protein [Sphaerochaetaceae bacterium]|nr:helicase-associated domain-containing protein [Sphaerochaetaceae bacterium]